MQDIPKHVPPGAHPSVQGYWARVWGCKRSAPSGHVGHTREFVKAWYAAWDSADRSLSGDRLSGL